MSFAQVNAARIYKGSISQEQVPMGELNFSQFPVTGVVTTFDATSVCPDSASTATAISCGVKTQSGVLGIAAQEETRNIAEMLKEDGWRIGIISTVPMNHATPAAFYAHVPSRGDYYDIAMQMAIRITSYNVCYTKLLRRGCFVCCWRKTREDQTII